MVASGFELPQPSIGNNVPGVVNPFGVEFGAEVFNRLSGAGCFARLRFL
jgi:hypothetical protein